MRVVLPYLYPRQREAIFAPERISVVEGSTKSGKTAGMLAWQLASVLRDERGGNHWWVAPVYEQARIAFRRAKRLVPAELWSANESLLTITYRHGARWVFRSGQKPDNLYGDDVRSLVIDEASRLPEASWIAAYSTCTATRAPIRVIGNVKGRGNWFFRLARRGEQGERDVAYRMLTAAHAVEAGVLHQTVIDQAERDLPAQVFRELYYCEPADAAYNPFDLAAIADAHTAVTPGPVVCWGLDLASRQDWTVLVGLDAAGQVAAFHRVQAPWQEIQRLVRETCTQPVLADATGVGDPVVESLELQGVPVTRYLFTQASKQALLEGLRLALADRSVTFSQDVIRAELDQFEYSHTASGGVRYSAPPGLHDDCVCALALAWRHGQQLGVVHGPRALAQSTVVRPPPRGRTSFVQRR